MVLKPATTGTKPPGAESEEQAARWVRGMFGRVASRYDLLNRVLSLSVDQHWRSRTVKRLSNILENPQARILDLCCGTGDLLLALEQRRGAFVFGSDFCHPMLTAAQQKILRQRRSSLLFEADALSLPLASDSFDLITIAFGFRNFSNYRNGLTELWRVLKPGGALALLEFSTPPNRIFNALYTFYSLRVLPKLGGWISGAPDAYQYLPESVKRFPDAPQLATEMQQAGFTKVEFERMTFGIVALHLGVKPAA